MTTGIKSIIFCLQFIVIFPNCSQRSSENMINKNRLKEASSPYLREHADNPVDWYEWGEEALDKAKKENKPLIISIGYSSCHWCHVMEEESFMDTAVARIMNENFVSIKIDREERPDIDQIYLNASQLISGSAGWPLNAFALPDGRPFYAGTYFPKDSWKKMLHQIVILFKNEYANVEKQADAITKGLQAPPLVPPSSGPTAAHDEQTYLNIFKNFESYLDPESGGLAGAPKFPMPSIWEFLLQYHSTTGDKSALKAVTLTLDGMANGGIYDHLGGGFARYATDKNWKIPHFEKMIYDNGQLVSLYAHAYQLTHNTAYKEIVDKTLEFIKRELTSPEGGFYSSLNADSEGEEGKYYVWTRKEIDSILQGEASALFIAYYQVTDSGNWENGRNILYSKYSKDEFSRQHHGNNIAFRDTIAVAEKRLLGYRENRIHPSRDEKILTSWNALMLNGYLDAYFATGKKDYFDIALKNAVFLEKNMMRKDGRLWRNYNNGKASIDAFLDDYSLLAKAYTHLYEATFDIHWLAQARTLADYAIIHFQDKNSGLFYYTSDESEKLVARQIEIPDNVIPSSNSVLADVLFRLGEYFDEESYTKMSKSMLHQVENALADQGPYYANWAQLLGLFTFQPFEVAIVGDNALEKSGALQNHYMPLALFMGGNKENLPLLKNKIVDGETIIYVCRNKVCKLPVQDVGQALEQLRLR